MSKEEVYPKNLQRTLKKLVEEGEELVMATPAIPRSHRDERAAALARIGMEDGKGGRSWIVLTKNSLVFVRTGLLWNRVHSFPLTKISGVEYVDEFHTQAIKIRIDERAEDLVFHDEAEGIRFYKLMMDAMGLGKRT